MFNNAGFGLQDCIVSAGKLLTYVRVVSCHYVYTWFSNLQGLWRSGCMSTVWV